MLYDAKGTYLANWIFGSTQGFEPEKEKPNTLDFIKQGVTTDELIKLKNADLI